MQYIGCFYGTNVRKHSDIWAISSSLDIHNYFEKNLFWIHAKKNWDWKMCDNFYIILKYYMTIFRIKYLDCYIQMNDGGEFFKT